MLELRFRRENNGSGGTNWHATGAEHEALIRMRNNQFRTMDTCGIWLAQLKHTRLAENLAVAATIAKLRLDRWKPRNFLPWSKQPFPFFGRILFL